MSTPLPTVYRKTSEEIVNDIIGDLKYAPLQWSQSAPAGAGEALARLFGRLADIMISRLNQSPENYFRTFLNDAGVDLLPPRPASAEATFLPAKDAPAVVRIPAGTQISTKKTAERPEIIFETQRDLNVTKADLSACIVVDPLNTSDRTAAALGTETESFAAFQGETPRIRILYLGDDALFSFHDQQSRGKATITLDFSFSVPGRPDLDGWQIKWFWFDGVQPVEFGAGSVQDLTDGFSRDGTVIFGNLPDLQPDKEHSAWLSCELTGGTGRDHLPVIGNISGSLVLPSETVSRPLDTAFSAIHSGTAFIPLDAKGEFFPLGQRPERLDDFYLKLDETYCTPGVDVEIEFNLVGVPDTTPPITSSQLNLLEIEWSYSSTAGWTALGRSKMDRSTTASPALTFTDGTGAFTQSGTVRFTIPATDGTGGNAPSKGTAIGNKKGLWLRARVTAGGYGLEMAAGTVWTAPQVLAPYMTKVSAANYSNLPDYSVTDKTPSVLRSSVDGLVHDHSSADLPGSGLAPFTSSCDIPALYLGFAAPFPAGEWVQLLLDVDESRTDGENFHPLLWEYWSDSEENWMVLPVSDEGEGLRRRGYLGFYGPHDQGKSSRFGRDAHWLRLRMRKETPRAVAAPEELTIDADVGGIAAVTLDFSESSPSDGQRIAKYLLSPVASTNLVAGAGPDRTGKDALRAGGDEVVVQLDASGSLDDNGKQIAAYRWDMVSCEHIVADAGADRLVNTISGDTVVQLDASGSFGGEDDARTFHWDLVSSERLVADAGPDRAVTTMTGKAVIQLDASRSFDFGGDEIKKYSWRLMPAGIEETETEVSPPAAFLKAIRWNTVPVLNAVTITGEVLGSSSGKANQTFATISAPVLTDIELYVREPDLPPPDELAALEKAADTDSSAAFPVTEADDQGVWVLWQRINHFYASGRSSRHFILDPASGRVRFGDGERGKIPPVGQNNIKAAFYRHHQGGSGNVSAGDITVIRNPGGTLALIKGVRNTEESSGGGDIETIEEVNERGPNTLKHRGKAITEEDFAWLAKDASGEIAAAWCLPTRDDNGMTREGYVTVVVVPDSADARPFPRPRLLRDIRQYLSSCALVNLTAAGNESRITIKGPEYVEAAVTARIIPINPEKADEVKFALIARLTAFLDPLSGGPGRGGWELGRDVYLSEVYEEMENVAGVDHVSDARLDGSIQQLVLTLEAGFSSNREVSEGGIVGTFDERIRYALLGIENAATSDPENVLRVRVYGLKTGDRVNIVDADNSVVLKGVGVTDMAGNGSTVVLDISASAADTLPPVEKLALLSTDETIRLPLAAWLPPDEQGHATAQTEGFRDNDHTICLVSNGRRDPCLQFMRLLGTSCLYDRIFIPEGHLACSGSHTIEMILEE